MNTLMFAAVAAVTNAAVQSAQSEAAEEVAELEPVVVFATRLDQTKWEVPSHVDVIARADIESSGAESTVDLLEKRNGNIRDDAAVLENVIGMCVADKAEVIGEDENDNGRRQILNFGHTAGHVIERDSGFTKPHGICVAKGMGIFMDACVKAGTLSAEDAKRMKDLLAMYKLPASDEITAEDIVKGAMNDKKKRGNTLSVILVNKIGKAEIKKMTAEEFLKFLSV